MSSASTWERLLGVWLERESGEGVEEFIARHPEHAGMLREHLALEGLVEKTFLEPSRPPQRLGPFRIEAELGSGGMGIVYRAVVMAPVLRIRVGSTVALKLAHPHLFKDSGILKRFLREAELGQRIDHPNVVRTLGAGMIEADRRPQHYLVMEYVEGQTLRGLMDDVDRVPEELARRIGCEVAKALSAIHAAGAVHRDLKPENVLITKDHQVKVMDLGIVRLADEQVRLSQTGVFVGSMCYAAPEQFGGGKSVDFRADLHGLGLLLYEIATGENPFADEDARVAMRRILSQTPRKAGELNPQLSPFFEEVLVRLLEKAPPARFPSADVLLGTLEEAERSAWWKARSKELRSTSGGPLRRIRVPRATAVYGRGDELGRLRRLFDEAQAGEGRVVLIEGEAGIGKTRLVDEFLRQLRDAGEDVNFVFASHPPGGAATASGAFSVGYREHLGDEGLEEVLAGLLPEASVLIPAFAALLRGDMVPKDAEPLTRDSIQTCFAHLTRSLGAERTTVILIDDLHFAPEEGRALFASIAMAVPAHRVLLVGTMRPGVPEPWIAGISRLEHASHLTLPRLGPKDLVSLLGDSFRSRRLAEEVAGKVGVKSDGNPFFVFEIIRGLREGQFITQRKDGSWHTSRLIEDIQIPSSVLDLVQARVADLDDEDRHLLDVGACWGYEFDPSLIASALGLARLPVLQRLAKIEKRDRLVRSAGRGYVFDHHQVQEALYGGLSVQLREEYHAALAQAFETQTKGAHAHGNSSQRGDESAVLCEHFIFGADGLRALPYLCPALEYLAGSYANEKAVALADRALTCDGLLKGEERLDVLLLKNKRLGFMGRMEAQQETLAEALGVAAQLADDSSLGQTKRAMGVIMHSLGNLKEARSLLEESAAHCRRMEDLKGETCALGDLGVVSRTEGSYDQARRYFERALVTSQKTGDAEAEARAVGNLGNIDQLQGRYDEALTNHQRHLTLSRSIGDRRGELVALGALGVLLSNRGCYAEAQEYLERSLKLSREVGYRKGEGIASCNLANSFLGRDQFAPAEEWHACHLAISREIGDSVGEAIATVNLSQVQLEIGRTQGIHSRLERALSICRETGARRPEGYVLQNLARVAEEGDDLDSALRLTAEGLALRRQIGHAQGILDSLGQLGRLRARDGEHDLARKALQEALALARAQKSRRAAALTLAVLASLPGGDAEAATEALEAAGEGASTPHVRYYLWQATGDRDHLNEAKRMVDRSTRHAPPDCRESIRTHVRLHRDILEAWSRP